MKPTLGRLVIYTLDEYDAKQINRRRTDSASIAERIKTEHWPTGAQAHIGNQVSVGESFPAIIVRVWGESEQSAANLQVMLDGNDVFWATSKMGSDKHVIGQFCYQLPPE